MSSLPIVAGTQAIAAFEKVGFEVVRVKSSHHIMKRDGHPYVLTIPVHGNRPLKRGTLRGLIRAAGLTVDQFLELL